MYGISTVQYSTVQHAIISQTLESTAHITEISYFVISFVSLTSWLFTWAEAVEVIVSSIRQVPGEGAGVDFGWGGGIGAERKPPMKQILLLHPDNLLVLWKGRSAEGRKEGREDLEKKEETWEERKV